MEPLPHHVPHHHVVVVFSVHLIVSYQVLLFLIKLNLLVCYSGFLKCVNMQSLVVLLNYIFYICMRELPITDTVTASIVTGIKR